MKNLQKKLRKVLLIVLVGTFGISCNKSDSKYNSEKENSELYYTNSYDDIQKPTDPDIKNASKLTTFIKKNYYWLKKELYNILNNVSDNYFYNHFVDSKNKYDQYHKDYKFMKKINNRKNSYWSDALTEYGLINPNKKHFYNFNKITQNLVEEVNDEGLDEINDEDLGINDVDSEHEILSYLLKTEPLKINKTRK